MPTIRILIAALAAFSAGGFIRAAQALATSNG
jgi:hypothetical protein